MKLTVSFHGVDKSDHLEEVLNDKLSKLLEKKGSNVTRVDWTFFKENSKESRGKELFRSKVHVHGKMKKEIFVEKEDGDVFKTVDLVVKALSNKLTKEYRDH